MIRRKRVAAPSGSVPGMNPMAGGPPMTTGRAPMAGRAGMQSPMKMKGRPLAAFMPSPKKGRKGKKSRKQIPM
jgi:hypothetical protein